MPQKHPIGIKQLEWKESAYAQIWQRVGNQITWINNQFYNNPDYDKDAATKVSWYQNVAAITGAQKLSLALSLAIQPYPGTDGYITLDDMIQNVITPLQAKFGSQFGGVMGWEFALDQGGTWGNRIGQALELKNSCPGRSYTVVAGDTLYLIAQRFLGDGTRWVELTKPDGTSFTEAEAENLQIGQVVCIPGQFTIGQALELENSCPGRSYTVVAGDTLYLIAQRWK